MNIQQLIEEKTAEYVRESVELIAKKKKLEETEKDLKKLMEKEMKIKIPCPFCKNNKNFVWNLALQAYVHEPVSIHEVPCDVKYLCWAKEVTEANNYKPEWSKTPAKKSLDDAVVIDD